MSRQLGLIAVLAPFGLMFLLSLECWHIRTLGRECETNSRITETTQAVVTTIFAWLATPPH